MGGGRFRLSAAVGDLCRESILLNSAVQYLYLNLPRRQAGGKPMRSYGEPDAGSAPVRVAFLCDEMTWADFSPLCQSCFLRPEGWKRQLAELQPDFFFCEACWSGVPPYEGCWRGRVYENRRVLFENRRVLLDILAECGRRGIPTVFWSKEDPLLFQHERYNFTDTALRFDHIFTTAAECVERYRALGHKSVGLLPFGVNPALFYPEPERRVPGTAIFAGSWFGDQPERCRALEALLDYALEQGWRLDIYDRHSGSGEKRFRFPARYAPYLRPAVSFAEMPALSRRYEWALNVNSVTDSATMFSRRVLQMAACGGKVLSNLSDGVLRLPGAREVDLGNGRRAVLVEAAYDRLTEQYSSRLRFDEVLRAVRGGKAGQTDRIEMTCPEASRHGTEPEGKAAGIKEA